MSIINKGCTMNNFQLKKKLSRNKNQSKDKNSLNNITNTVSSIKETNFQTTQNITEQNTQNDFINQVKDTIKTTEISNNINNLFSTFNFEQSRKQKQINSIIFLDWDDTLFCTSLLKKFSYDLEINKYPKNILIQVAFLEIYVINLLEKVIKKGDTYIISNSLQGWVEYCCKTFFPNVLPLLNNVKIFYSKINYMKKHPKCALMWKRECFNEITNTYNLDLPSNIISIGDSISELEAGRNLENKFKKSFIKTIKFKKEPSIDDLIYELSIVNEKFDYLCETCKNWNVFCEKKIKNQNKN